MKKYNGCAIIDAAKISNIHSGGKNMKMIILFTLVICLCFAAFGGTAFAETAATEKGLPDAMFTLGEYFYEGKGSEKDPDQAAEWYRKALDAGYEPDDEGHEHMIDVLGDDDTTKK
jgi:hypothetical protein